MRQSLVLLHRYIGLTLAGFLCLAGATGALLAWNESLDASLNPSMFRANPPAHDSTPIDPLVLLATVEGWFPKAQVLYAPLTPVHGGAFAFYLQAPDNTSLPDDQIFIDPYTATFLGARKLGDLSQGLKNLMPFVERLHHSLAIEGIGTYAFGIVALLWTFDCFVGAWLTLPIRSANTRASPRKAWLARWRPAWGLRISAGGYKLNFDMHRAFGLWLWLAFIVLAWSAVSFNLPAVYEPIMKASLAHQPEVARLPKHPTHPQKNIGWQSAREVGRQLMKAEAATHDFRVIEETALQYDPVRSLYIYSVLSSLDVRDHNGLTSVTYDAATGDLIGTWFPTRGAAGDTVRMWLASLHMASKWGWPYKLFITLLGLAVVVLSTSGIVIWKKKRRSRHSKNG